MDSLTLKPETRKSLAHLGYRIINFHSAARELANAMDAGEDLELYESRVQRAFDRISADWDIKMERDGSRSSGCEWKLPPTDAPQDYYSIVERAEKEFVFGDKKDYSLFNLLFRMYAEAYPWYWRTTPLGWHGPVSLTRGDYENVRTDVRRYLGGPEQDMRPDVPTAELPCVTLLDVAMVMDGGDDREAANAIVKQWNTRGKKSAYKKGLRVVGKMGSREVYEINQLLECFVKNAVFQSDEVPRIREQLIEKARSRGDHTSG